MAFVGSRAGEENASIMFPDWTEALETSGLTTQVRGNIAARSSSFFVIVKSGMRSWF
jgi:hypothetical protein